MPRHRRAQEGAHQKRCVKRRPLWVSLVIVLTLLVVNPDFSGAFSGPGSTHPLPHHSTSEPQTPAPVFPLPQPLRFPAQPYPLLAPFLFLAALGLWGIAWRRRKAAAISLTLILGFFAFETALHSVHHLSDPQKGAHCPVFSASQHITGAPAGTSDLCTPTLATEVAPSAGAERILPARFFRPDQGRAPPSLPA